jgi:CheY-like chemotaxis protein
MVRILLIDPDREHLAALQRGLAEAGYTTIGAVSSGSFALTMLERDRPDLIVCRARVPDIDGYELCSIVRSDPALKGVLFLLLADAGDAVPGAAFQAGADRFLVGELDVPTVVDEVRALLPREDALELVPAVPRAAHDLRGSLDVMDVADITQAIGLGGKTGHLILVMGSRQGTVAFERGRVIHAEFGDLTGEEAFVALVAEAQRAGEGSFCFIPLDRHAPGLPRTIERSVEQLLLGVAAELDERRLGERAAAPTA